jgi:hypothetical protein
MATRIALAQQKEAALARIAEAAAKLSADPPPAQGKQDADAYTAAILDWAAGTLDALAAPPQPTAQPAARRSKTKADEGAE